MMKLSKALMLSVSGLMFTSGGSLASIHNLTSFNTPGAVTFVHTPYTHTSHSEETLLSSFEDLAGFTPPKNLGGDREGFKPTLSLPKSLGRVEKRQGDNKNIQLAATCFVTDTSACSGNEFGGNNADDDGHGAPGGPSDGDDYDLDNAERCRQEGYTQTSCPKGQEPSNTCPYDSDYFEKCVSSCPSNYVTCEVPYYGVGEDCDGKYASCEKDTERACQELNPDYVDECGTGQQLSDDRCSYDNTYGTCCNTCWDYAYTLESIPDGYIQDGEPCITCDGLAFVNAKPNPCDGFMDCGSMGPDTGANSCLSGNQLKYSNCKPCPNLGSLTYCPEHFTCTYEECSGLWYKTGCQSGYDWNSSSQTCTQRCEYKGTLSYCPANYTCNYEDCSGKYYKTGCQPGYDWNAGFQTCTQQCENKGTLTSCPAPFTCHYEDCSGKYYKTGCQSGYDWDASSQTCTAQCDDNCPNGYSPTNNSECYDTAVTECGTICYKEKPCCRQYLSSETKYGCSCSCETSGSRYVLIIHKTKYFYDEHGEIIDTGSEKEYHNYFATIEECEERKSDLSQCNMSCDSFASSSYSEICE